MARSDAIQVEGAVVEVLPNRIYRVQLANGHQVLAHASGKMRLNFVRFGVGDKVTLQMSPYDLSQGSITMERETEV